jgi:hypothetical protein
MTWSVTPLAGLKSQNVGVHVGEECLNAGWLPEKMKIDEVVNGKLVYPFSETVVDVTYMNLRDEGSGSHLVFF